LSMERATALADGRFFLGVEAKDVGLVDELGGKEEALAYVGRSIGEDVSTVEYEPESSFFDDLFGLVGKQREPTASELLQYLKTQQSSAVPLLR
jgi:protease IV